MAQQRVININDVEMADLGNGAEFVAKRAQISKIVGSTGLGCAFIVVPPGKKAFPFHRHHAVHELFFIVSGEGECRVGDATVPVKADDMIAAPAGAEAHQLVNTGPEDLRYLAISTMGSADIVEYPDSGKIAAAAGMENGDFSTATFKTMGRIQPVADYYQGETSD